MSESVTQREFGVLPDGRMAQVWTLSSASLTLEVSNYGARIVRLLAPDRDGTLADVVLGRPNLQGYLDQNGRSDYQGAFIGRFANRLGGAELPVAGQSFRLDQNDGRHNLHGGVNGFHQLLFELEECVQTGERGADGTPGPFVSFTHLSADGESGFPGALRVGVRYRLNAAGALELRYTALAAAPTVFNPTNHAFFNLSGDSRRDVLSTELAIFASQLTVCDDELIPTGELRAVAGGPYDFRVAKPIGRDIAADERLLRLCGGYDQNFCVDGWEAEVADGAVGGSGNRSKSAGLRVVARAWEPESGRVLEVASDLPGIQLYTFNSGDGNSGALGKEGRPYAAHTAFCLETQFWPDTPHHPHFPPCTLKPEQEFTSTTEYRFSTK